MVKKLIWKFKRIAFPGSVNYWEKRYRKGQTSGVGSYGKFAEFKAKVLNEFTVKQNIQSVVEFGCGDGNQLSLLNFKQYTGLDVSAKAIEICSEKFSSDTSKTFVLYTPNAFDNSRDIPQCDAALSLDVIFHLVEDEIFHKYMCHLFDAARKYVIIYSTNKESKSHSPHYRQRKFTDWIDQNKTNWKLVEKIENEMNKGMDEARYAEFFIYCKSQ